MASSLSSLGLVRRCCSCWRPTLGSSLLPRRLSAAVASTETQEDDGLQEDSTSARGYGPNKYDLDMFGRAYGTGRRKRSTARVWLTPGEGRVIINSREIYDYFPRLSYREKLVEPFVVTGTVGHYDVWCTVKGGGTTGQAGAISLGIARALQTFDPDDRIYLKKEGLLTRDPREVERKKPGQPKARKKDQWVKR